jgi:hypothetical protein
MKEGRSKCSIKVWGAEERAWGAKRWGDKGK